MKLRGCVKLTEILHAFGPKNFVDRAPEFLDLIYKIEPVSDHMAKWPKFHGDRPKELGDYALKKRPPVRSNGRS